MIFVTSSSLSFCQTRSVYALTRVFLAKSPDPRPRDLCVSCPSYLLTKECLLLERFITGNVTTVGKPQRIVPADHVALDRRPQSQITLIRTTELPTANKISATTVSPCFSNEIHTRIRAGLLPARRKLPPSSKQFRRLFSLPSNVWDSCSGATLRTCC